MAGWQIAVASLLAAPGVVLGLVLVARRHWVVGLLLVSLGAMPFVLLTADSGPPAETPVQGVSLLLEVVRVAGWVWFWLAPGLLVAYFPDGRVERGGRWLPAGWVAFVVLFHVATFLDAESYGTGPDQIAATPPVSTPAWISAVLGFGSLALLLLLLIGSVARIITRMRRGDALVRRQMKWFAMSALLLPLVLLATWLAYLATDLAGVVVVVGLLSVFVSIPLSVGVAVLRHDLYDIDRLFSASVAYVLLSAVLAGLFAAITVSAGLVVGHGSDLAVALATLACAVTFGLVHRRVQAAVDLRFDRDRREALAVVEAFTDAVREGTAAPEEIEAALGRALRDPTLKVLYAVAADSEPAWHDSVGRRVPAPAGEHLDLTVAGRLLAAICYTEADRRPHLMREVLRQAHLPLELAHSRLELREALAETEASRARLLEAADAERRRLERDLHDGAQQKLIAIGMSLRLAQRRSEPDDPLQAVLSRTVADLQEAVAELRRLANGVRPQGLDEGLAAAIRNLARRCPIQVQVDVTADPVPEAQATTAYYVVAEALTNALKHAEPSSVAIDVARRDGTLTVRVDDDGHGGALVTPGAGLAGLRDRVAAVGGTLVVQPAPTGGTRIYAELPCEAPCA